MPICPSSFLMATSFSVPFLFATAVIFSLLPQPLSAAHFLFPLSHTLLANSNSTAETNLLHLLKSSSLRSTARHHRHCRPNRHARRPQTQVSLPLSSGSDYTLSLSVAPNTTISLYMDTGSDLVWFPCHPFECILCDDKPRPPTPPPPPPLNSVPIPCDHPSCSAAHSSLPSSDLCAIAGCPLGDLETSSCSSSSYHCPPFYYAYGDGSLIGRLLRGGRHLSIPSRPPISLLNFTFACSHTTLAEPVGVAGFGGGPLSLPAQLSAVHPALAARFSYCLVSHAFQPHRLLRPSPLILGRSPDQEPAFIYTPMLPNPKHPYFYTVGLEAITVGDTRINAPKEIVAVDGQGNGGLVVDSGTTFTMLPAGLYRGVAEEFGKRMAAAGYQRARETEAATGLGPCYYYGKGEERGAVPAMVMEFGGGAAIELPRRNYFMGFEREKKGVGCLMLMNAGVMDSSDSSGGPVGTLGNYQQQGFEVVYDLEGKQVGFARRRCAALWDSLARG